MKNLFIFLMLLPVIAFGQSYSDGYEAGYKKGYCAEDITCVVGITPVAPISTPGKNSYNDGYNRGVIDGNKANSSSGSSKPRGRKMARQIVDYNSIAQAGAVQNTTGDAIAEIGNQISNIVSNIPPPPPMEEPTKFVKLKFEKNISGYKHLFVETKGDDQMKVLKNALKGIESNTIIKPLGLYFLELKYGKWNLKRDKIIKKIEGFDSSKMLHLVIIWDKINYNNFKATIALRDFKTKEILYVAEHKNLAKGDDFFFFLRKPEKPEKPENLNDLFN